VARGLSCTWRRPQGPRPVLLLLWLTTACSTGSSLAHLRGRRLLISSIFLTTLVLPGMTACVEGGWAEQPPRCILVLDNARIKDEVALQMVRAAGVFDLLLPPYSPDLNPIADVFSVGSSWLRRWCSPDQFNTWPMTTLDSMLLKITGNM